MKWKRTIEIPSKNGKGDKLVREVIEQMKEMNWSREDVFSVHLSLVEAINNAITHGNNQDISKKVHIECSISEDIVTVKIKDEGKGFSIDKVEDPRDPNFITRPSGRGIFLINGFMSNVKFNELGNELYMEKFRTLTAQ